MPSYRVQRYELHVSSYFVKRAACPADAIEQVLQGQAHLEDNSSEFLEPADAYGVKLPAETIEELRRRGLTLFEERVPSIRRIDEA